MTSCATSAQLSYVGLYPAFNLAKLSVPSELCQCQQQGRKGPLETIPSGDYADQVSEKDHNSSPGSPEVSACRQACDPTQRQHCSIMVSLGRLLLGLESHHCMYNTGQLSVLVSKSLVMK